MNVAVSIPAALRQFTNGKLEVVLDASTVEDLILKLDDLFRGLKTFILDENKSLRRFVNIFVNNDEVRLGAGLMTKLKDGDRAQVITAVAGG